MVSKRCGYAEQTTLVQECDATMLNRVDTAGSVKKHQAYQHFNYLSALSHFM
jgi:hypothetical protein